MYTEAVRLSRWTHTFKSNQGYFALYHSLNMEVVFLEQKFYPIVKILSIGATPEILKGKFKKFPDQIEDVVNELCKTGLVVPVKNDDMTLLEEKRKTCVFSPGMETLYLIVADKCNLRCEYCFVLNNMPKGYKQTLMPFSVAKEAIDMFFKNVSMNSPEYNNASKAIYFYGGEPFINFPVIRSSVEYIEATYTEELSAMGDKFRISIVTNGTLVTKEIAEFIAARKNIHVAISIDGPQEVHDAMRKHEGGRGSFAEAMRGFQLFKQAGKNDVAISSTVSSHNIDKLPLLLELHRQCGFASINLNPLTETASSSVGKPYMRKVSQKMLEYFELAREEGVYEDRVMRKVKAFTNKRIHTHDCQGLGGQLVCAPDGQLGICHEGVGTRQFFFGHVSREFDFHHNPMIAEWKKRTPLNMSQCFDCPAIGVCGGGCAYGAWLRNGSIWAVDDRFCTHSLATLKWLIWDLFKNL